MTELPDIRKFIVDIDKIENNNTTEKNVSLSILRLDKIHPEISGNKFFKLYYFLKKAIAEQKKIITFGGAWSNHLAATAKACNLYKIKCIGIVRGEEPKKLSQTVLFCREQGMQLVFISREAYKNKSTSDQRTELTNNFGEHILIPEGGYSKEGTEGAALIHDLYSNKGFTHICGSVGTGTTLAGLINASLSENIIGFSALKDLDDFESRMQYLLTSPLNKKYFMVNDYHFGGYAKKTPELISFMNRFYEVFLIPTDFVYTGKMMFGVLDLMKKNYFAEGSKVLCIHTGGLQGNLSLPPGTLNF